MKKQNSEENKTKTYWTWVHGEENNREEERRLNEKDRKEKKATKCEEWNSRGAQKIINVLKLKKIV